MITDHSLKSIFFFPFSSQEPSKLCTSGRIRFRYGKFELISEKMNEIKSIRGRLGKRKKKLCARNN